MFGILMFLTALSAISADRNNFESLLNSLRSQNLELSSDETSSSDSSDGPVVDQLKRMDLENLVNLADELRSRNNISHLFYPPHGGGLPVNVYYNTPKNNNRGNDRKKQLAKKTRKERKPYIKIVKKRKPANLLDPVKIDGDANEREQVMNMNDYSKIYVVLDPQTLQTNTKRDEVSSLLSKILAGTSSGAAERNKMPYQYRGFNVKDNLNLRRYRRDSKEMYGGGGGSMEDEYRPKRSRSEHGGGGRTAIPYIRHRGDIYERDN